MAGKNDTQASGAVNIAQLVNLVDIYELGRASESVKFFEIDITKCGKGLPDKMPLLVDMKSNGERAVINLAAEMETLRQSPAVREGLAIVTTLKSFIDLVNYAKTEASAIFAKTNWPDPHLLCVIDYNDAEGNAAWRNHRIRYPFPVTEEFANWIKFNGVKMEQGEFAAFLEDHAAELASPSDQERSIYEPLFKERFATPAQLIDLSRSLEVFVGAKVKRQERIQSGERVIHFDEQHMDGAGNEIDIPGIFMLNVPAFVDGEQVRIPTRLRYRVMGGSIAWYYSMYRWVDALRLRCVEDMISAGEGTTLSTYEGEPEAAASRPKNSRARLHD